MCPASSILLATPREGVQAAEDASAAAVVQHVQREYVLSYAGRGQDDPFGVLLGQVTFGGAADDLIPEGVLEYRRAQLVLAKEGELAAVLEVEEIGQAVAVEAFGASGAQAGAGNRSRERAPRSRAGRPDCRQQSSGQKHHGSFGPRIFSGPGP
jgi:hypothetical protein